jgi:hypothetical protein
VKGIHIALLGAGDGAAKEAVVLNGLRIGNSDEAAHP